jgi:hypothetical protein
MRCRARCASLCVALTVVNRTCSVGARSPANQVRIHRTGRRPHRWRSYVDPSFLPGVCNASGSLTLLDVASWSKDCSQTSASGAALCYYVDRDPDNDAEPWQELELIMFERWLASESNCNAAPASRRASCRARADVVVVPSALAHCRGRLMGDVTMTGGGQLYDHWTAAMTDARSGVHAAYWDALRRRDEAWALGRAGRRRPPLIVIHYDGVWQMPYAMPMLQELHRQPADFVRRIGRPREKSKPTVLALRPCA